MNLKKFIRSALAFFLCITMIPVPVMADSEDSLSENSIVEDAESTIVEDEVSSVSEESLIDETITETEEILVDETVTETEEILIDETITETEESSNEENSTNSETVSDEEENADETDNENIIEEESTFVECTLEEHVHITEECYTRKQVCENHSEEEHTAECFETVITCGYEEHIHDALACYGFDNSGMMLFAARPNDNYNDNNGGSNYYKMISNRNWEIAPGVMEYEHVLNNEAGTRRQVLHTATIDLNNEYVKVIPGTKGMWPEAGNYGTESTSTQALNAEKLGYGNVVVATNASLSWYTEAYYKENPHLIGEPLGYSILDGKLYANSRWVEGKNSGGVQTITVINYDYHPITGEKRPDDMPKVWIRNATDPLTGWEEQAIPVLFGYLVKPDANGNPVNQYKEDHGTGIASRTFVGVRADGSLVLAVSDGEQAPYSTGFTSYEMAEYMIKMGCVIAANCDGGGSTTFCSQRPGEDLKVNCSLSDGGERPTSNTFLVVSTAKKDGEFARATISTDYDYYTPGSTVKFNALGTDVVGTKVEIPEDAVWTIKEDGMGEILDGVFVSNGTTGTVTAQLMHDGDVVGEYSITIEVPTKLFFEQPVVTIPFGKTAKIPVKATAVINGVEQEIGLSANDVTFTTTNAALGTFEGLDFTAVDEANAPENTTSTVTATLKMGDKPSTTVQLSLGKASVVLWDFEDGQADIDEWNVINNRKNAEHWDYELALSLADKTNGQVHDGNYSMRLETNGLSSKASHSEQYAWIRLGVDGEAIVLENARTVGFWLYVPEDNIQCWVQGHYKTDSNGDGTFDTDNVVSMMESENVYYNIDESGWHYLSMDISAFNKIALQADKQYDKDPSDGMTGEKGEFFLAIVFHKAINNKLWQENGSINGNYTYYIDNFTVDYSEAVEDRENPVFDKIYLDGTTALIKRDVVTTTNNVLNLSVAVADQSVRIDANKNEVPLYNASGLNVETAKAYIDGVEVECAYTNGKLIADNIEVADGYHRVKFEICDNAGNKSVIIRVIKVEAGTTESTINVVPDDPTLDRIPFGSVYWMNLEATQIETIESVSTVIDLNNVNHWELDHMELAEGFTAEYTIAEETNTATITIIRTGENDQTGKAVLAKLPVRILYFDTDIKTPGYTAQTYWTTYAFWAQDMKMDVDMGLITHVDGNTSTFSNEEFHVDTEMYTSMANMDKAYFTEHGTTHVHTPVALEDKAAECAVTGYTGRTFCAGCNSVVEWGTTIPANGHTYKVSGDKLVCDCGKESKVTGLQTIDGKNYYAVNGKLQDGWIGIGDDWYYFDKTTFEGWEGEQYTDKAIKYTFDGGRVTEKVWVKYKEGMRYWYGPDCYKETSWVPEASKPYVIDGITYLFNKQGYMQTGGITKAFLGEYNGKNVIYTYYYCNADGSSKLYTGPYNGYFYHDGRKVENVGIIEDDGNYYYIGVGYKLAMSTELYFSNKLLEGTELKAGYYKFDADGKMILQNGVVGSYFYKNSVRVEKVGVIEFENNYYYIGVGYKIATNCRLYFNEKLLTGTPLKPGYYNIDAEGKFVFESGTAIKNGPVGNYFYRDNIQVTKVGVVEFEGHYYYIGVGYKVSKDCRLYFSEKLLVGTSLNPGYYDIDADGKLIIRNGVIGNYFYRDNIQITKVGVIEFEGHYYYIGAGYKVSKNCRLYFSENLLVGTPLKPGYCDIDEDGKLLIKNGPIGDYFYLNNAQVREVGLIKYNNEFYYIGVGYKIATDVKLYFTVDYVIGHAYDDGTIIDIGYHYFDETSKMVY